MPNLTIPVFVVALRIGGGCRIIYALATGAVEYDIRHHHLLVQ